MGYHSVGELMPQVLREIVEKHETVQGPLPEKEHDRIYTLIAEMEKRNQETRVS